MHEAEQEPDSDIDSSMTDNNWQSSGSDSSDESGNNGIFGLTNISVSRDMWLKEKDETRALARMAQQQFLFGRSHFRNFAQLNILNLTHLRHVLIKLEADLEPLIRVEMDHVRDAGGFSNHKHELLEEKLEKLKPTLRKYSKL